MITAVQTKDMESWFFSFDEANGFPYPNKTLILLAPFNLFATMSSLLS
jgi:hypothetical protein